MSRIFSAAFEAALAHAKAAEGGWSDNPIDPGGATMKGVTLKLYREWRRNPAIGKAALRAITDQEVREIFHDLFWRNVRGDDLPPPLALMVFDAAINSGVKNAGLALQRSIASFSPFGLKVDGVIGPQTIAAANGLSIHPLIDEFSARRALFYGILKTFREFGLGWLRRLMKAKRAAEALASGFF